MHSILSFAVNGAQQQFRNLKKAPESAKRVFDYCQVPPREKWGSLFEEMRPVFECEDSWLGVFKGRADFVTAVRNALPAGFTRAAFCPKSYDGLSFLGCLRSSENVEVLVAEDGSAAFPQLSSYSFFVVAPPLPPNERARAQEKAAKVLAPLFAAMTQLVMRGFGESDGAKFAAAHAALLKGCEVLRPPTGRPVLDCELRDLWSFTKTDLTAAVHDSLPQGFHRSTCVERGSKYAELSSLCERNAKNIELHFGEFLHIEADDIAYPASRAAAMRQFLEIALAAAANNFQGFDSNTELPYFGRCSLRGGAPTEPRYLECQPDGETGEFDLLGVVRRALPPGYAAVNECTVQHWAFLNPSEAKAGCFRARNRAEIDVAEYEYWFVDVGLPNPKP